MSLKEVFTGTDAKTVLQIDFSNMFNITEFEFI